ncbi:MAG: flagellar export protein FliJ [Phycisphaerales bacterium]|nr:flagellar export protein FliJ [Phycisphaerales bacterium]
MPGRFRFRLQPVLEMRERAERDHQLRVAGMERERQRLELALRAIQAELEDARAGLRDRLFLPGSGMGLAAVRLQANASLHITLRAQRAAIELAGAMKRLESARADLLAATTARRAVQTLKDKRRAEHMTAQRRAEDQSLDDLTVMRHGRAAPLFDESISASQET